MHLDKQYALDTRCCTNVESTSVIERSVFDSLTLLVRELTLDVKSIYTYLDIFIMIEDL